MVLWKNHFSELLKIEYPIIQPPMLGVSTPAMVAAISNAGGLGSLPVGGLSAEVTSELIRQTKSLTSRPFAVNLFIVKETNISEAAILAMEKFLEEFCFQHHLPFEKDSLKSFKQNSYLEQIPIMLKENITVVSFTFGIPDGHSISKLKKNDVILIGTATSLEEGKLLWESGTDAIAAQGLEAGGHRGTFIEPNSIPLKPALSLTEELTRSTSLPIITAGGMHNGQTIRAAFAAGAACVQIGTSFIGSKESSAAGCYKAAILNYYPEDTILTKAFTGKWARGIRNKFMTAFENSGLEIPAYPLQQALTNSIRQFALKQDAKEYLPLWAGQYNSQKAELPVVKIFTNLIEETEKQK